MAGGGREAAFAADRQLTEGKKSFNKTSLRDFIRLIRRTKPRYGIFTLGVIFGIVGSLVQLFVPKMVQPLVNSFSQGVNPWHIALVVGLYIASAVLSALAAIILGIFGESVVKSLRTKLWDKMIHLKVSYFDNTKAGELSSRLANDTMQVKDLIAVSIPQALSSLLLLVGSIIFMIQMQWQLTLAMVIAVPVAMLAMIPTFIFGQKIGFARQDSMADFQGIVSESLGEIRLIKSSNGEKQATDAAEKDVDSLYKVGKREAIFDGLMQPIMMLVMMLMIFGLLAFGVYLIATHVMTLGTLLAMMMYLMNLIGAVPTLSGLMTTLSKTSGSTARITELLNEPQEVLHQGQEIDIEGQALTAENISFSYEDSEPILKNISFEAQPNTIVAFAGPSGGGKSTLFALLERFYEPTAGELKIGETKISDVTLHSWRNQIGYVAQDSSILAGTIRYNLTYGLDGEFSDEELWHVLELAYARGFVEQMPEQLDTEVGERGVKISGGQRQRIAIARAFLRNPKILMLDEATASLDSESEAMVQKALDSLMKGRTTLVIAHRLSTIVDADNIYFIEKGQITGSGKHQELVKTHPLYAQYVKEQLTVGN